MAVHSRSATTAAYHRRLRWQPVSCPSPERATPQIVRYGSVPWPRAVRGVSPTAVPSRRCHRWPPADRRRRAQRTRRRPSCCHKTASSCPGIVAHSRTVPSALLLVTRDPSPESATPERSSRWPRNVTTSFASHASQSRTVPSAPPLTTSDPFPERATPRTAPVCPRKGGQRPSTLDLPRSGGSVPASAGRQLPVTRQCHQPCYPVGWPGAATPRFPQPHRPVLTTADQQPAVVG